MAFLLAGVFLSDGEDGADTGSFYTALFKITPGIRLAFDSPSPRGLARQLARANLGVGVSVERGVGHALRPHTEPTAALGATRKRRGKKAATLAP